MSQSRPMTRITNYPLSTYPAMFSDGSLESSNRCSITLVNIEEFRGELHLKQGDLPYNIWVVFDEASFRRTVREARIVPIASLISTKNEMTDSRYLSGEKPDPRITAFEFMKKAAEGKARPRGPLQVIEIGSQLFEVKDGNATAQVLMLVGWREAPVELVSVS